MSPRRKPAFQDFQEFSEPVPYQREGDFQRGGGRWGSEPVPKERKSLSLIRGLRACPLSERIFRACPLLESFQREPVPYWITPTRGGAFRELLEPVPYRGGRWGSVGLRAQRIREEFSEPVPYQGEPVPCNWGRFRSWCGIRVKVKTGSGTNSAKMTQLVSEKGSSKELFRHRRA
jgi:hypothetical protein